MGPPKATGIHNRSGSPMKSPQGHDRKVKKSLSFEESDEMEESASGLDLQDGGAHGSTVNMANWERHRNSLPILKTDRTKYLHTWQVWFRNARTFLKRIN